MRFVKDGVEEEIVCSPSHRFYIKVIRMDDKIRYDIFYGVQITQYTKYIRELAMVLAKARIIDNFIEDLSKGRSKEFYAVDPPKKYYLNSYDSRYVKQIKASYYNKSFRKVMDSPYLGFVVVNTKDVPHKCPHYNQDAVCIVDDKDQEIEYVEFIGYTLSRGFIPIDECFVPYYFLSNEFHSMLKESDFNLGDEPSLIDIFSNDSITKVRLSGFFGDGEDSLKSSLLYKLKLSHYTGLENKRRYYSRAVVYQCRKCGYDKCFCPQCCSFLTKCPKCGGNINFANMVSFEANIDEHDDFFDLDCEVKTKLAQTISYNPSEDEWSDIQVHPINARYWSGLDLFCLVCPSNRNQETFCTGRFAKWLIDNQLGPVSLVKYPFDVSECSQDELDRLNSIAYGEPYVPEK